MPNFYRQYWMIFILFLLRKVKEGRGSRHKIDDQTFSGFSGPESRQKKRGLNDGFASSGQVAREIVNIDHIVDYTHKQSVFERVAKYWDCNC